MKKRLTITILAFSLIIGLLPMTPITAFAKEETHLESVAKYKTVLNDTMTALANNIPAPKFGTSGGEWTVISLARGGYYSVDDKYFDNYYANICETVPGLETKAVAAGKKPGALDKNKSTENSRLIMALAAIDKDPTNVGGVNVLGAYDTNGMTWITKQGINGPIFALIALDTNDYETSDTTLRSQCVDYILSKELEGGGWALSGKTADPDITSMALQALIKYKSDARVLTAANKAIKVLSSMQKDDGGFASWGSVNSESIAQVITALSIWGIDADKDERFIKQGNSALDALLNFYVKEDKGFAHVIATSGKTTVNAMATDQACYALVAYDRFVNDKAGLYDMTDVKPVSQDESQKETEPEKQPQVKQDEPQNETELTKQTQAKQNAQQDDQQKNRQDNKEKTKEEAQVMIGDINNDGIINAQDALDCVNLWLKKSEPSSDNVILAADVTGDGQINELDVSSIVEFFVNGSEFIKMNSTSSER